VQEVKMVAETAVSVLGPSKNDLHHNPFGRRTILLT